VENFYKKPQIKKYNPEQIEKQLRSSIDAYGGKNFSNNFEISDLGNKFIIGGRNKDGSFEIEHEPGKNFRKSILNANPDRYSQGSSREYSNLDDVLAEVVGEDVEGFLKNLEEYWEKRR
jgi:hypothetical protein